MRACPHGSSIRGFRLHTPADSADPRLGSCVCVVAADLTAGCEEPMRIVPYHIAISPLPDVSGTAGNLTFPFIFASAFTLRLPDWQCTMTGLV